MYVYIYISWAIEKSGCVYDSLQIILLVGNDIHDKWICETTPAVKKSIVVDPPLQRFRTGSKILW